MQSPWELSSEPCEEARECEREVLTDSDIGGVGHTRSFYLLGLSCYTRSSRKPLSGLLG